MKSSIFWMLGLTTSPKKIVGSILHFSAFHCDENIRFAGILSIRVTVAIVLDLEIELSVVHEDIRDRSTSTSVIIIGALSILVPVKERNDSTNSLVSTRYNTILEMVHKTNPCMIGCETHQTPTEMTSFMLSIVKSLYSSVHSGVSESLMVGVLHSVGLEPYLMMQ